MFGAEPLDFKLLGTELLVFKLPGSGHIDWLVRPTDDILVRPTDDILDGPNRRYLGSARTDDILVRPEQLTF